MLSFCSSSLAPLKTSIDLLNNNIESLVGAVRKSGFRKAQYGLPPCLVLRAGASVASLKTVGISIPTVETCTFESESGDATSGESTAHQFPLATIYQNWTAVKLYIPAGEVKKVSGGVETHIWANNLGILAAEESRKCSANDAKMFIKEIFDTLMKESEAQAELLKLEEGCRIETTVIQENKGKDQEY